MDACAGRPKSVAGVPFLMALSAAAAVGTASRCDSTAWPTRFAIPRSLSLASIGQVPSVFARTRVSTRYERAWDRSEPSASRSSRVAQDTRHSRMDSVSIASAELTSDKTVVRCGYLDRSCEVRFSPTTRLAWLNSCMTCEMSKSDMWRQSSGIP